MALKLSDLEKDLEAEKYPVIQNYARHFSCLSYAKPEVLNASEVDEDIITLNGKEYKRVDK